MELLPRDVIGIVHRYLFRDAYDTVVRQYQYEWILDKDPDRCLRDEIFWDDSILCFRTYYNLVANFRVARIGHRSRICKFGTRSVEGEDGVRLPSNY